MTTAGESMRLVRTELQDKVLGIEISDPATRNALSGALQAELLVALDEGQARGARVAILKGSAGVFCSGYSVATEGRSDYVADRDIVGDCARLEEKVDFLLRLRNHPLAIVAQVEGHCLAGGTDLMLSTDVAIVAADANIGVPNVRGLGISLLATVWPLLIGPMRTKMMMFTGDSISGTQAAQWGLAAMALPPGEVAAVVQALAQRIALTPPSMLAIVKRASNRAYELAGLHELARAAVELDAIAHATGPVVDFWSSARAQGLRAALKERDLPYAGPGLSAILARAHS